MKYVCDDQAVEFGVCEESEIGTFLTHKANDKPLFAPIRTEKVELAHPRSLHYPIKKTGFYCVTTHGSNSPEEPYLAAVVFQNPFGQLPASDVAKLPFFSVLAIVYALILMAWLVGYVQFRKSVLPLQTLITAFCAFLVVEMIIIWGYYDFVNTNGGHTAGSTVYLIFLAILTSLRNAVTFFLLLIVCLGYGVVKPTLGDQMKKCGALAALHFVCSMLYTITTTLAPHDKASTWLLIAMLPLLGTTSAFFFLILSSLTDTIQDLEKHHQHIKAQMYMNLWRVLLGSILVIFAMFFFNLVLFLSESSIEYITRHWRYRWFMLDGWSYVLFCVDLCIIAFIWRPVENNQRFAMSQQIAQEDDGFDIELGSFTDSEGEEEDALQDDVARS